MRASSQVLGQELDKKLSLPHSPAFLSVFGFLEHVFLRPRLSPRISLCIYSPHLRAAWWQQKLQWINHSIIAVPSCVFLKKRCKMFYVVPLLGYRLYSNPDVLFEPLTLWTKRQSFSTSYPEFYIYIYLRAFLIYT